MPNNAHTNSIDLTEITYIGRAVKKALEKGGKKSCSDLAGSTAAEIEAILKKEVAEQYRTPEKIDVMLQEARTIVKSQQKNDVPAHLTRQNQPSANSGKRVNKAEWLPYEEFAIFFQHGHSEDGQKRWKATVLQAAGSDETIQWGSSDGAYIVKFEYQTDETGNKLWRTRLVDAETETEVANFTGKPPDKWWPWIVEEASLTQEAPPTSAIKSETLRPKPQLSEESQNKKAIHITRFKIHRPADKRDNVLAADVEFEISDELLAQQPSLFLVELLYVNLETHASHLAVCESERFISNQRDYQRQIEFPMPEFGDYRPHCVVFPLPFGENGDYREDRVFAVVPKK